MESLDSKVCYLSGPMSGRLDTYVEEFREYAEYLKQRGYDVINPAELEECGDPPAWIPSLCRDIGIVVHPEITTVAVMPGWLESQGALLEVYVAWSLGKTIINADTTKPIRMIMDPPKLHFGSSLGTAYQ